MEQTAYRSCVKINGIPILPPLMTDDIKEEMNYYKQLAIAVEERLNSLQLAKQAKQNKSPKTVPNALSDSTNIQENSLKISIDNSLNFESESTALDTTRNVTTLPNHSTKEEDITSIQEEILYKSSKSSSDDENNCQHSTQLNDSISSDAVTMSTDLNQYFNESISTKTTTEDATPDIWKPQVPKTLDIMPISVEGSRSSQDEKPSSELSRSSDNTPKILRQGSYILDTPSPILLAHLHTEFANNEYVPTPSSSSTKRKEWNITQAKTEWENQVRNTDTFVIDSGRSMPKTRPRRNSASNAQTQKTLRSISRVKNGSSLGIQQPTKSVDCIQAMLSREFVSKSSGKFNIRSITPVNGEQNSDKWKTSKSISILSLADKLEGSLGSLSKTSKGVEKANGDESLLQKNRIPQLHKNSLHEHKSSILPEKMVLFFREIQENHKKEMAKLLEKQQQEQIRMQEEFKKQQLLLLMQIKKTLPGSFVALEETVDPELGNSSLLNGTLGENDIEKCPLNYVCPLENSRNVQTEQTKQQFQTHDVSAINHQRTKKIDIEDCNSNDGEYKKKHLNVSRQLFPLDSKTTLVPIIDNTLYTDKHHHAAIMINAYSKGYLVRRLMKTERIIALKNTYREALHCMLKLHVDAPLNLSELNFHRRLQLQCDAASSNIVDLFAQNSRRRMEIIAHDREIKKSRPERPNSARSYSFATQRTLARKKLKEYDTEMGDRQTPLDTSKSCTLRARCQTWTSNTKERRPSNTIISQGIKRSTSAGAVRKPWR